MMVSAVKWSLSDLRPGTEGVLGAVGIGQQASASEDAWWNGAVSWFQNAWPWVVVALGLIWMVGGLADLFNPDDGAASTDFDQKTGVEPITGTARSPQTKPAAARAGQRFASLNDSLMAPIPVGIVSDRYRSILNQFGRLRSDGVPPDHAFTWALKEGIENPNVSLLVQQYRKGRMDDDYGSGGGAKLERYLKQNLEECYSDLSSDSP